MKNLRVLDLTGLDLDEPFFFIAATRGKKYVVSVYQGEWDRAHGKYSFREYTSGKGSGGGGAYSLEEIRGLIRRLIASAARIDGIHYEVYLDELEIFPRTLAR
jgi:hypothetical protein